MAKMKKCSVCGADIASSAKACPKCGAKNKKPIFLRAWFILLLIILGGVGYLKIDAAQKDFTLEIGSAGNTITMKASELSELAENDTSTYDQKYFGKDVVFTAEVTGTHGRTTYTNISTTYDYSLDFGDNITVGFDHTHSFAVGDMVTVHGKLFSSVYDNVYIDGIIVS